MFGDGKDLLTWAQFTWVVGIQVTLMVFIGGALLAALRTKANALSVARLWDSHNEVKKGLADFKVEVAQTHPTHSNITDMEARITKHMDEKFDDIKEIIKAKKNHD